MLYAKCFSIEKLELWDDIYTLGHDIHTLWLVGGGYFNFIVSGKEKIGWLLVYPQEYKDLGFCINSANYLIFLSLVVLLNGGIGEMTKLVFLRDWNE